MLQPHGAEGAEGEGRNLGASREGSQLVCSELPLLTGQHCPFRMSPRFLPSALQEAPDFTSQLLSGQTASENIKQIHVSLIKFQAALVLPDLQKRANTAISLISWSFLPA